ncbi:MULTISPECIES: class I SAM-dependent methyltransferase [unclassified Nitratiruptor]|uniref:class I SAM-dependent DNA methyltransferase n=1 Tax=unclassified Nitratiruptor TaxID=2624044 RepID=UPI0019157F28|nr:MULTISPECIES: class I SAM-dependent methyltransferase [unclassified Nitratiruptor]BCD60621.1 methyltransferase [Nitratiruptor sp. YY08-10]BCD64552.1 methyltransferase [Nitratiruptor sp. YY08-14]
MSSFDERAKEWDKNSRRVQTAQKVAKAIKECVRKKSLDILDFGCGTGLVSYELTDIANSITGVDTAPKMVEMFNAKSPSPSIKAYCKDIDAIEPPFDLIVSSMTFHHIEDIHEIIGKLYAKLKSDGIICIADLVTEDGTFHSDNRGVHHFGFDPKWLEDQLQKQGFTKVCQKIVHTIQKHKAFDVFLLCMQKG